MTNINHQASNAWLAALDLIIEFGEGVAPRGQGTRELAQYTYIVDMRHPVVAVPERQLNYRFMAAEAVWIISGDDRVSTIEPWNARIAEYSDNGETFFGAYGPKYTAQLPYVVRKLVTDPDTRQAGLTLWRESPPDTKDVPCTVAMFFAIRGGKLNMHVFMRSSDVWLGIPYDLFNFSMIAHDVCLLVNQHRRGRAFDAGSSEMPATLAPGMLLLTAASAHLYDRNREAAQQILHATRVPRTGNPYLTPPTPTRLFTDANQLLPALLAIRDGKRTGEHRWWEG